MTERKELKEKRQQARPHDGKKQFPGQQEKHTQKCVCVCVCVCVCMCVYVYACVCVWIRKGEGERSVDEKKGARFLSFPSPPRRLTLSTPSQPCCIDQHARPRLSQTPSPCALRTMDGHRRRSGRKGREREAKRSRSAQRVCVSTEPSSMPLLQPALLLCGSAQR